MAALVCTFRPLLTPCLPPYLIAKLSPENHLSPAKHPANASKEKRSINVAISVESIEETMKAIEKNGGAVYQ
jgi:hypothetical protein